MGKVYMGSLTTSCTREQLQPIRTCPCLSTLQELMIPRYLYDGPCQVVKCSIKETNAFFFLDIYNHVLWIFSDRLQVGMFAISSNVISYMQKPRILWPKMMNTIATYNENNKMCVKHEHQNKSSVDSQSWLCILNMTNQSTMGTKNAQTKR